jgi:hypothetical protein
MFHNNPATCALYGPQILTKSHSTLTTHDVRSFELAFDGAKFDECSQSCTYSARVMLLRKLRRVVLYLQSAILGYQTTLQSLLHSHKEMKW